MQSAQQGFLFLPLSPVHDIQTLDRTLPLSPRPPWCPSCSGGRECVWGSGTASPPLPTRTPTGTFKDDAEGEARER